MDTNSGALQEHGAEQQQLSSCPSKTKAQARGERAYKAWKAKQEQRRKGAEAARAPAVLECAQSAEYAGVIMHASAPVVHPSRRDSHLPQAKPLEAAARSMEQPGSEQSWVSGARPGLCCLLYAESSGRTTRCPTLTLRYDVRFRWCNLYSLRCVRKTRHTALVQCQPNVTRRVRQVRYDHCMRQACWCGRHCCSAKKVP